MAKVTCKYLKEILRNEKILGYDNISWCSRIYKGHNGFTQEPETRVDLAGVPVTKVNKFVKTIRKYGMDLWQDNPANLKMDFIICWKGEPK